MMKKLILVLGILIPSFLIAQTSIYDIQYTTNAGDGSYPSNYDGQIVTTGGIVSATEYLGSRYFIECSNGGAWNGLFVYDNNYSPNIGDSILITGTVAEYQGYTEIKDLTSFSIKSTGNELTTPTSISTSQVTSEAYEGIIVELIDADISMVYDTYGNFQVNDGSGNADIRPGIFSLKDYGFPSFLNYPFEKLIGVVGIHYGIISVHPRDINDFKSDAHAMILSTEDKSIDHSNEFFYPVYLSILNNTESITSYSLKLQFDNSKFQFNGFDKSNTLSETGAITDNSSGKNIELNYAGSFSTDNKSTLINLRFKALSEGEASVQFNSPGINGSLVDYSSEGNLAYYSSDCDIPKEDTLTIVQRPLLNIPSIVTTGQEMDVVCFAPQGTTDWNVELFYDNITVPLSVNQSVYDSNLKKWTLTVSVPSVELYELYDMRVTASGGISDEVVNSVKIINNFKEDYYFIQITDLHLPGKTYYGESGYETDHTELDDLQAVIDDINLLNPEFVLLTGDIINEGELEDFECLRHHSLTYNILKRFEMPIYVVPGNHDLGGWDATPPTTGTARKEWWKFFGWRQHNVPPAQEEYYSHDYSFDYGNTHFVGLESYDNYDNYMHDVYGQYSFISSQLSWLNNDLAAAGDKTKVLFYHADFKNELDLSTLGVDMALWGHIHKDEGDINTYPYNLSTDNVCNGNRAFRVIYVNGNILTPKNSIRTHSDGDMLTINYAKTNDGTSNNNSATIKNNYNLAFANGLVKFVMPKSNYGFNVKNGTLQQTMVDGSKEICYVSVNIPSGNNIVVSIEEKDPTSIETIFGELGFSSYPNPFSKDIAFEYELIKDSKVYFAIYSLSGQLIYVLRNSKDFAGDYKIDWDAINGSGQKVDPGTYIYNFTINDKLVKAGKIIYMK